MKRTLGLVAATALAAVAFLSQAQAAPIVTVDPATQDVAVAGTASVNIVVSGLTEGVGGFSFDLAFDPTLLAGASFVNDPGATMGALPLDLSGGFGFLGPNNLDVFFTADASADAGTLSAAQGASFILTTITFTGLANGLSPLSLSNLVLSNWDGTATLASSSTDGSICVGGNCGASVPEPSTLWLLGLGLMGLGLGLGKGRGLMLGRPA